MTTPIDTTRLRANAEAVRDAGAKSAYAHHVVRRLVDAGHSDLTGARKDAREAAEALRAAQKALYADAPPDAIILALLDEVERLRRLLNTPELHDFAAGVVAEAAHQRSRWGSEHDAGKAPADWFWLLGYLGGKALAAALADNTEKALHHCISSAAALANWHAALSGASTTMRPGIDESEEGSTP